MRWGVQILLVFMVVALLSCTQLGIHEEQQPIPQREVVGMKLTSPDFQEGNRIPERFSCDGENINPRLEFKDVPVGAKSLVLIMDDPDIPEEIKQQRGIQVFDHWVLFNIDPGTTEIGLASAPGQQGVNGRGNNGYTGPCPPPQYEPKTHRYFFKLYALDIKLDLETGSTKKEVEDAMQGHIVAQSFLYGTYSRS